MTDERYQQIMAGLGMPHSRSLLQALQQVANEAAQEAHAVQRERCAAWVEARRNAFCEEHGSVDPDTGALEFGRGQHAEAKSEYVHELEEIAAGLRAL